MAKTISQLTAAAGSSLNNGDLFEIEQSGVSKKATLSQIIYTEAQARIAGDAVNAASIVSVNSSLSTSLTSLQNEVYNNRVSTDGTTPLTDNWDVGAYKLTNLAAGTTAGDSVRYQQAILTSGVNAFAAAQSMGGFKLTNLAAPAAGTDATNRDYVLGLKITQFTAPTSDLNMNSNKIIGVSDPSGSQDVVTLTYLKDQQGTWNFAANTVSKSVNSSYTLTSGTDKNYVRVGNGTVTGNKTITIATGTSDDNKFIFMFQPFKVANLATLTLTDGGATLTFEEGSYNSQIVRYMNGQFWIEDSNLSVSGAETLKEVHWYKATYDFDVQGGAISTIDAVDQFGLVVTLPNGSIILKNQVIIECETAFTSGGAATLAWGYTGTVAAFDAATGFGVTPYTTSNLVDAGSVTTPIKLTGPANITITIAGAAITAGKANIYIPVLINKF